jgi:4-hydroxy-tetrahydrodipicolinate synthase
MLKDFQPQGFDVFAGSETIKTWQASDADAQQERLNKTRAIFQKMPIIPAMKAAIAEKSGDKVWANVRPPLVELDEAQRAQLIRELDADGFEIPNAVELADTTRKTAGSALALS